MVGRPAPARGPADRPSARPLVRQREDRRAPGRGVFLTQTPGPIEPDLARREIAYLETIGRRSGRPHLIEIWFAADPERPRVYVLAGGRDSSDWVRNVRADPRVRFRIEGRTFVGRARDIEGTVDEVPARHAVGAKYGYWREGTELRGWARDSLAIAIDLEPYLTRS